MSTRKTSKKKTSKSRSTQTQTSASSTTWQLFDMSLPEMIDPAGITQLVLVISADDGQICFSDTCLRPPLPGEVEALVVAHLHTLTRRARPGRLIVSTEERRAAIQSALAPMGVAVLVDAAQATRTEMLQAFMVSIGMPAVSLGRFMGVRAGHEALAAAAARIAAHAPWKRLDEREVFELSSPERPLRWPLVSFIGEAGEQRGVVFYRSVESLRWMLRGEADPEQMLGQEMISLLFLSAEELDELDREVFRRRGLVVHDGSYPLLQQPRHVAGRLALDVEDEAVIEEITTSLDALASVVEAAACAGFPEHLSWPGSPDDAPAARIVRPIAIDSEGHDSIHHIVTPHLSSFFTSPSLKYSAIFGEIAAKLLTPTERERMGDHEAVPAIILPMTRAEALAHREQIGEIEAVVLAELDGSSCWHNALAQVDGRLAGHLFDWPTDGPEGAPLHTFKARAAALGGYGALVLTQGGTRRKKLGARDIVQCHLVRVAPSLSNELVARTFGIEAPAPLDPTAAEHSARSNAPMTPWRSEVAAMLVEGMRALELDEEAQTSALTLWADAADAMGLSRGAPQQHAAAVCYCLIALSEIGLRQSDVARVFEISSPSISKRYRAIWEALNLDERAHHYRVSPHHQPMFTRSWQPPAQPPAPAKKTTSKKASERRYLELEITLRYTDPKVWRRIQLPETATFAALHDAIQTSFGWEDCHLWEFRETGRRGAAICTGTDPFGYSHSVDDDAPNASALRLSAWFRAKGDKCDYIYDFGDGWVHQIKLRKIITSQERFKRRLIAGQLQGPPEDCGGPPGYERCCEVVLSGEDPWGEDVEDLLEWLCGWRPDSFELGEAQRRFNR